MWVCVRHMVNLEFVKSGVKWNSIWNSVPADILSQSFAATFDLLMYGALVSLTEASLISWCVIKGLLQSLRKTQDLVFDSSNTQKKKVARMLLRLDFERPFTASMAEKNLIALQLRFNFPTDSLITTGLNSGCISIHNCKWLNRSPERCNCM